ncbi:MAG TPA: theronine dehydrogenase [Cyanobacteria bacterium UBA11149]|nr:theronine dehydrogenase [Cyanobacteria bacterium UBA11367]HBE58899.1 theronine dehydrogenase [Cyanobacteria bacterium UBA11366]HBK65415.1 theronine dehydrogenase [Cyanobacteria bacterium UBA11166]HBR73543.1 theronine dehydrogenase [Cyanobacteria bacterium UBA11159]HBS71776.1 theronine dehydrogenase [Cyanobacteria bacterium UBA11153]HBW92227.1 theronine dehydrogenase [Cyanobacteria bacterium UBA11149]HCA93974.1 theronine dehydrogenase [Cyanobacteria bacterium UBA9226]
MKAAVLYGKNQVEIRDVIPPTLPQEGEVIADVEFVGVCKTDQQLTAAGLDCERILGHEVVCKIPNESGYFALNNEISCGKCSYCQEGLTSHCQNLQELGVNQDGGYAEKMRVPKQSLHHFDFSNPALGVLIEPLSCAVRGVGRIIAAANLLSVSRPTTLVIGGGLSGALIAYLLTHSPEFDGEIKLYDITKMPIPWAEKLGIERVAEAEADRGHLVIECSGTPSGLATALGVVRKAGIVCIYGVPKQDIVLPISPYELFMREIAVVTSFAGATDETMGKAISYIKGDETFFAQLLGRGISLEQLPEELTCWNPQAGTRTFVNITT